MSAVHERSGLTGPVEDYLKAIYDLELDGAAAATTDLATVLGVAPASVTGMIRRLADQGLVTHEPYRGVRLTRAGRLSALRTLRRHRVIEAYLVNALGYSWDQVHEEAERLEHAASDELIDRMARSIGEPKVDPHGAPIPNREGAVQESHYVSLADLRVGASATIMRIADEDPDLLRHVADLALVPGCKVSVLQHAPFGGPITLETEGGPVLIGPTLAQRLLVDPRD